MDARIERTIIGEAGAGQYGPRGVGSIHLEDVSEFGVRVRVLVDQHAVPDPRRGQPAEALWNLMGSERRGVCPWKILRSAKIFHREGMCDTGVMLNRHHKKRQ